MICDACYEGFHSDCDGYMETDDWELKPCHCECWSLDEDDDYDYNDFYGEV